MQLNLIRLRKMNKLKQVDVAKILELSRESYGQKERGEYEFTSDEMFTLRDLFKLPMDQIFLPRKIGDNEFLEVVRR